MRVYNKQSIMQWKQDTDLYEGEKLQKLTNMSIISLIPCKPGRTEFVRNSVSKENHIKPNYAMKGFFKYFYQTRWAVSIWIKRTLKSSNFSTCTQTKGGHCPQHIYQC